jgi:geranylgeranyl diphosphate synthase type II
MTETAANNFDLEEYLGRQSSLIDGALEHYLGGYPEAAQTLYRAMRRGVIPGGKRIRPILTLAAGELFGADAGRLLPFACAVELIHAYSLIHDDLPALDDDDFRRGEPAVHKIFGDGMALLAGDGLLTEAFHLLSGNEAMRATPPETVVKVIRELAHAAGPLGLVGGQALDLEAEEKNVDLATVEMIHVRKTGALILAAIRIGAHVAQAEAADLARLSRYGEYLGLAFQIADDILDSHGSRMEPAQFSASELKKATYPSVVGIAASRERLGELLELALGEVRSYGARGAALAAIARQIVGRAMHGGSA